MRRIERLYVVATMLLMLVFCGEMGAVAMAEHQDEAATRIMRRVDANHFLESVRMESEMIIRRGHREIVKEMITYSQSDESGTKARTEFVNPRDRGTKYLMLGDDLWMFFPDAEDLVSISGHLLRDGMMGSDFSYEDILESNRLTELYRFVLEGEEEVNGRGAYVLSATAHEEAEVSYYQRKVWVDTERYVVLREELFSRAGRLLKVMEVELVRAFEDGRYFPVEIVMRDKIRRGTETLFRMNEIEFGLAIPHGTFSLESLQ